ncbi:MAG: aldo/keto reductase [Rhodospirillales bacterium]|nr:aldo/keto reductase [Rhodospirillales bacterium]MDE2391266.1 aldo/keto reductase [Rhodospirillales bacterium]
MTIPRIVLPNGVDAPALGQGSWYMGEDSVAARTEITALQAGIDLGMTLIDTAEMYADGGAEEVVGQAITGRRDGVFLVSKVYPHNASAKGIPLACARSLKRLRTDRIDLYLLHWRGAYPLAETVDAFERLRDAGHIGAWGVSNFDTADMAELARLPSGGACAVNQVLYNPEARGIEFDLLPWCKAGGVPVMAYSPLGQAGRLLRSPALVQVGKRHGVSPAQVALAWSLRGGTTIAIPKASSIVHVRENAAAVDIRLTDADLATIDAAFAPPRRKQPLAML